jgi:hypothetical protein
MIEEYTTDHNRSSRDSPKRSVHFTPDACCCSGSPRTSSCRRARSRPRTSRLLPWARSLMADVASGILPVSGHSGPQVPFPNRRPSGLTPSLSVRRIDLTGRAVAFDGSHKALLEWPCPAAAIVTSDRDPSQTQFAGVTRVRDQHGSQSGGRAFVTSNGRCGPRRR